MSIGSLLKNVGRTTYAVMKKNGHIALGIGAVLGLFGSVALAYTTRPKVDRILSERKKKLKEIQNDEELEDEEKEELEKEVNRDTVKELAKTAGPIAACFIITAGCMGGVVGIAAHRIDTLTTIAKASDIACNQLALATEEVVGEEKANEIKAKAAEKTMAIQNENNYKALSGEYVNRNGFIVTGKGDVPFYDSQCGRTFLCSIEAIEHGASICNDKMCQKNKKIRIQYNEFCHEIGLPPTRLGEGRYFDEPIVVNLSNAIPWGEGSLRVMDFQKQLKIGY